MIISRPTWSEMTEDDLQKLRDEILQSDSSSYVHQRMLVYLGMATANKLIMRGDYVLAEKELEACIMSLLREDTLSEDEDKIKILDVRKIKFLQFEAAVLRKKYSRGNELRLQINSMVDPDCVPYYSYLCYSAGVDLLKLDRPEEAMDWLNSVLQVDKEFTCTEIKDASIKSLIVIMKKKDKLQSKMKDVMDDMVEMLSSKNDRFLIRLDLASCGFISPLELSTNIAMSYNCVLDLISVSHNNPMQEKILEWLLLCIWEDFSPSQKEECLAKMMYVARMMLDGTAFVVLSKYLELLTSAGPKLGKSIGMVMEVGDQAVKALGMEGKLDKMEEWLKALSFLSSIIGNENYINHFAESYLVLLLKQGRYQAAVNYIDLWRKAVPGYNAIREQLQLLVFLKTGDSIGAVDVLKKVLLMDCVNVKEEEVGHSLRLLIFDLVEKEKLDPDSVEQLLMGLADRKFFFSLDLVKFATKLVVNLERYQLLVILLVKGKVKDWLSGEDNDLFLSKLCWDLGLSSASLELKHNLLCVSGQLLGPEDIAGQAARLASIPAGLAAMEENEGEDFEVLSTQLEEELNSLEKDVSSREMKRTILLYQFKLFLLDKKTEGFLDKVVDKMSLLGDVNGLEAASIMGARLQELSTDRIAVKALMEAQRLDKKMATKTRRAVLILEIMSRKPDWWQDEKVVEVVRRVEWRIGDMLAEAVKMTWNSWVVVVAKMDGRECGWGKALVWLHNIGTDVVDHITCKLEQPTITLLRKIRRVVGLSSGQAQGEIM